MKRLIGFTSILFFLVCINSYADDKSYSNSLLDVMDKKFEIIEKQSSILMQLLSSNNHIKFINADLKKIENDDLQTPNGELKGKDTYISKAFDHFGVSWSKSMMERDNGIYKSVIISKDDYVGTPMSDFSLLLYRALEDNNVCGKDCNIVEYYASEKSRPFVAMLKKYFDIMSPVILLFNEKTSINKINLRSHRTASSYFDRSGELTDPFQDVYSFYSWKDPLPIDKYLSALKEGISLDIHFLDFLKILTKFCRDLNSITSSEAESIIGLIDYNISQRSVNDTRFDDLDVKNNSEIENIVPSLGKFDDIKFTN